MTTRPMSMFSLFRPKARKRVVASAASPRSKAIASSDMAPGTPAQEEAKLHLERACLQAEACLGITLSRPALRFDIRGKTAGMAYYEQQLIRLNPTLLEQNPDSFFTEVIPHELCHLLAFKLHGRVKPHGAEWQHLMRRVYGLIPRATHNLDIASVSRSVNYRCGCGEVPLSIRRHNKVARNQARYLCRHCGQYLEMSVND